MINIDTEFILLTPMKFSFILDPTVSISQILAKCYWQEYVAV